MKILRLKIENLRSLASVEFELNHPGMSGGLRYPNVNVILGGNGSGKTSILRAAALAVLGPLMSRSSGYVPEGLIRRPPGSAGRFDLRRGASSALLPPATAQAEICLDKSELPKNFGHFSAVTARPLRIGSQIEFLGTSERMEWGINPPDQAKIVEMLQYDDSSTSFFLVGYGASRRVEASSRVDESARIKSRRRRYERVASLFEDHLGLMPLSYWLPGYEKRNKGRYVQVIHLINKLLPEACRIRERPSETSAGVEHLFEMNGVTLPFRALSDGYRAYIGWIGDMLFHLCMGASSGAKLVETRGVVLIDEIDLHLHPEWQRVVLPTLSAALPNVQFIVTTHSPLVVGSLEAANLFLLVEQDGASVIKRLPEPVYGRSSEQILLSPYFGLESTRAPGVSNKLTTLANAAVNGDPKASLAYLRVLSGAEPANAA
jgi:hypothetical protein